MVMNRSAVLPPDLRPWYRLDGGRLAPSDLNDSVPSVIKPVTNRLERLLELKRSPTVIVA